MEIIEVVVSAVEIADALKSVFDSDGDGEIISQELIDVIDSFGNGETGDNDIETLLVDIKSSLTYDEDYTALQEISSRLELIDTRLDTEFTVINEGLGLISACFITFLGWKFFNGLYSFLKIIAIAVGSFFGLIFLITLIFILIMLCKGNKIPKRTVKSDYKKRNIFIKLFYDLPKAKARDFFQLNPDSMPVHGMFMFCGSQGSGKTISAIYYMRMLLQQYPLIKIRSNISISFQHGQITHWKQLINVHNGEIGQIDFLDETQNWFSSNESKNFPPDMLQEITQERKKHKVIMGTSQVFTRLAKPLREQTTYLCEPHTIAGCFTICPIFKPILKDDGTLLKKKFYKIFCFVHDDELRECYNTYERVERLASKGFQEVNFNEIK